MRRLRSPGRNRYKGKSNLSLNRLLNRQPKSIKKHPHYELMISHYRASDKLKALRINRQCYRLLDKAVISAQNLPNLYRTYRIPRDPFFPLFIKIKKDYLADRLRKTEEREKFILKQMKKLPRDKRRILRFLAELEESLNPGGVSPIWEKEVYPASKKRALQMLKYSETQWLELTDRYFEILNLKYPAVSKKTELVRASLFLGIIPGLNPLSFPGRESVNKTFRKLSRIYHPDSGGDGAQFIQLQKSRDLLLQ